MKLVNAQEAAEMTGLSPDYFYLKARNGEIKHYRFGSSVRFDSEDVEAFAEQHVYIRPREAGKVRALQALADARKAVRHG